MNLLAIDTATEQCSAAIVTPDAAWLRVTSTARSHADLILPMIDELLTESGLALMDMDALAFGRGPGSFTGVRIAVGVIQGLALARGLPVVGISNLAAVAQRAALEHKLGVGARILVCMDARMQEVYWAQFVVDAQGQVMLIGEEQVTASDKVQLDVAQITFGVGTGWRAYPELATRYPRLPTDATLLPRAEEIARLAMPTIRAGQGVHARDAQPVYLRDNVAYPPRG